ncbi:hypothetical protein EZS27_006075 [termite gut metagenome]|uniref:DUF935 family protein n=1 Tax=termite gut metagenome TaxID=433724 RepID=A0A5J4SML5_9ZZZZ
MHNDRSAGYTNNDLLIGGYNLAREADKVKLKSMIVELVAQTQALTTKDIKKWRNAWQAALNVENPRRGQLYDIYTDTEIDLHLTGCIGQRKGFVRKKSFMLMSKDGKENEEATELFESKWFKNFVSYALDSRYWGHSLIQLGDVITLDGKMTYSDALLVPRKHVVPEYGVIITEQGDEWKKGYDYRNGPLSMWCIEAGEPSSLGLFLRVATQTIPKKNMLAFWDMFGEMFGMPIRIGKTITRDPKERTKIEKMLAGMGAAAWGLFPEGTEIEIKETTRGDAFQVYDKRIERANNEISKGILNQTMTIENGSSLSQSQVHLEVFNNVIDGDADFIRDLVNDSLLPRMIAHGFPLKGLRFNWDESLDYTPDEQVNYETMIADHWEVDPEYFVKKYKIPIIGEKKTQLVKPSYFFD